MRKRPADKEDRKANAIGRERGGGQQTKRIERPTQQAEKEEAASKEEG